MYSNFEEHTTPEMNKLSDKLHVVLTETNLGPVRMYLIPANFNCITWIYKTNQLKMYPFNKVPFTIFLALPITTQ